MMYICIQIDLEVDKLNRTSVIFLARLEISDKQAGTTQTAFINISAKIFIFKLYSIYFCFGRYAETLHYQ